MARRSGHAKWAFNIGNVTWGQAVEFLRAISGMGRGMMRYWSKPNWNRFCLCKCCNQTIHQPVAHRAEGIAWKIFHNRLGPSGARCDRRLALLYRARGLVSRQLVSRQLVFRVSCPTPPPEENSACFIDSLRPPHGPRSPS
jgi:hypothetical protein